MTERYCREIYRVTADWWQLHQRLSQEDFVLDGDGPDEAWLDIIPGHDEHESWVAQVVSVPPDHKVLVPHAERGNLYAASYGVNSDVVFFIVEEREMTEQEKVERIEKVLEAEIAHIVSVLMDIQDMLDEEIEETDVRLRWFDGGWNVYHGDSSYDQDHRGFWGASSVRYDDSYEDLESLARELIDQVVEHAASV